MYRNLLIPVVFDDKHDTSASFRAAAILADEGASFTVLHVMDAIPGYVEAQLPADLMAETHREASAELRAVAEAMPGAKTVLLTGNPGRMILDYADAHGTDCIIVASHTPGLENIFLGSTADRVVRHARCAVHVIR